MIEHQILLFETGRVETDPLASGQTLGPILRANDRSDDCKRSDFETSCPVCGSKLIAEKCKVVCRSEICTYRLIFNCSEF